MYSVADLLTDAYCKPGEIGPWLDHVLADGPQAAPMTQPPPSVAPMASSTQRAAEASSSAHAGRRSRSEGQPCVRPSATQQTAEFSGRATPPISPGALPQHHIDALRAARGHKGIMAVAKHIVRSLRDRGVPAQFMRPARPAAAAPPAAMTAQASSAPPDVKGFSPSQAASYLSSAHTTDAAEPLWPANGLSAQEPPSRWDDRNGCAPAASARAPVAVAEGAEGGAQGPDPDPVATGASQVSAAEATPPGDAVEASAASASRGGAQSDAAAVPSAQIRHIRKLTPPPLDVDLDEHAPPGGHSPGKSPFSGVPRRVDPGARKSQSLPKPSARVTSSAAAALTFRSPVPRLALRNWSIVVTGHSLGAGVAAFVLLWLRLAFPAARVRAWLFGCPAGLMSAEAAEILAPWCTQVRRKKPWPLAHTLR